MYGQAGTLAGKVALVTGVSHGIGASICRALVPLGVKTIGVSRNIQQVESLRETLKNEPGELVPYACDITVDDEVRQLFAKIKERYGGLDICINNAGRSYGSSLLDGKPDEWRNVVNLNLVALCFCTKLSVESMLERKVDGHIVNVSSLAGHLSAGPAKLAFYSASKHAVRRVNEGFRQELRRLKSHIRISSISPGFVNDTQFLSRMLDNEEKAAEILAQQNNLVPDDVAKNVLNILLSPPNVEINDVIFRPVEMVW